MASRELRKGVYWILDSGSSSSKPDHMLINSIMELASDALAVLSQSNQGLLQQRPDGIPKKLSREYILHLYTPEVKKCNKDIYK